MGKTFIEKIFSNHSNSGKVKPGNIVWIDLDVRSARDFGGPNVVKNFEKNYGDSPLDDINKTFFTFDTVAPAKNIPYANNQHLCRMFARKRNIKVYDVDSGIGTHVLLDKGLILPGYTAVGTDSHYNILGAVGAFGQGMGDQDITFAFKTGKTWFEVPESIKINIKGDLPKYLSARDLILFIVGKLGSKGALGKSFEYYGNAIDSLSLDGRITVASMMTEMGGIVSFIPPNEEVLTYLSGIVGHKVDGIYADHDAEYSEEIDIDISYIDYMIAQPPKPDNVTTVSAIKGKPVDSGFIGSCTNGRWEDMMAAAEILKGRKVNDRVMLKIVPATKEIYGRLLKEGIIDIFFEAGAIISNAGCGGCASGQIGMTGQDEVQLSTSNRNFTGKQGAGETYLTSPAVVAASAVAGEIITPEDL